MSENIVSQLLGLSNAYANEEAALIEDAAERILKLEAELSRLQQENSRLQANLDATLKTAKYESERAEQAEEENSQLREYLGQLQQSLVSCAVQLEPNNEARKTAVQIWQNPPALGSERVQEERR